MTLTKEENIYMAKICEQTERFDEMVEYMRKVLTEADHLNTEERNLLSVAFKNSVGTRRTAWRIASSLENKEESKGGKNVKLVKDMKTKLEGELDEICNEIIGLLDSKLIESAKEEAEKIFYIKMKADYYRYIAEYAQGGQKKKVVDEAHQAYKDANEISTKGLKPTNPIRLGLSLNYSVFFYESLDDKDKACEFAKQAFDDAIAEIDQLEEDDYKDSTTIMQLLRDNLTLWESERNEEGEEDED